MPLFIRRIAILAIFVLYGISVAPLEIHKDPYTTIYEVKSAAPPTVEEMIIQYANQYGVPVHLAMRVADCESNFDPLARNPASTAKGVYQFIDSTWAGYCDGNVLDAEDNIQCFMQLYPHYRQWWVCK